jgi:hypothetical protein
MASLANTAKPKEDDGFKTNISPGIYQVLHFN